MPRSSKERAELIFWSYVQRATYKQADLYHEEVVELDSPWASEVATETKGEFQGDEEQRVVSVKQFVRRSESFGWFLNPLWFKHACCLQHVPETGDENCLLLTFILHLSFQRLRDILC